MEGAVGGTWENISLPLGMEEREKLIAWAAKMLKEETDDEILGSVFELLRDLRTDVGMRKGLKNFRKNGWAFIRKTQERISDDFNLPTSSSSMMMELKEAKLKRNLESRLDHETHPLNNELILKKIFEFSSVKDLKNFRLVSKKWCDLSLSAWRGKAVFRTNEWFGKSGGNDEDATTEAFIRSASKLREVPFQRYNMHCLDQRMMKMLFEFFSSSIYELYLYCDNLALMSLLFTKLPELRVLRLRLHCSALYGEYRSIISKGLECPFQGLEQASSKLYKLELDIFYTSYLDIETIRDFPWKKIFRNAPVLKCLLFNSSYGLDKFMKEQIIMSVCEVRKEGIEVNFPTFELEELTAYRLDDYVVSSIVESRFPLRSLCIHVGNETYYDSSMLDLLEAHAETLQYIKCEFWRDQEYQTLLIKPYFPSKVRLPNLKKLILRIGIAFTNLLCSLAVPNLEDLIIEPNCFIRKECLEQHSGRTLLNAKIFRDSCIYPNLTKFFYNEHWNFSAKELRVLAKAMPNLIDLGIPLDEATFPIVYEVWPGLQSLHLFATSMTCPLVDDYAITGFLVSESEYGGDIRAESRESNITNLRNLRKFILETTRRHIERDLLRPRRAWITDSSAVHGFLQLPILEILDIETVCKFSPSVMVALKDHVWELKIREPDIFRYARADFESDSKSDSESSLEGSQENSCSGSD